MARRKPSFLKSMRKVRRGSYILSRRMGDVIAILGGPTTIAHRLKNKFVAKAVMSPKRVGRVFKWSPFAAKKGKR